MADLNDYALALTAMAGQSVSNYQGYKYSKRLQEYQLELNKQQFDYQAQLQRDYQNYLWHNQGAAQVSSYKQAGLNPAGVNSAIVGASLPSLSSVGSGGSYSPTGSPSSAALNALRVSKELRMQDAQTNLLNAQARNLNSSSNLVDKQVESFEDTLAASLGLSWSQTGLNSSQTAKAYQEIENLQSEIDEIASRIAVNESSVELNKSKQTEALAYARESNERFRLMPYHLQVEMMNAAANQVSARAAMKSAEAAETTAGAAVMNAESNKLVAKGQYSRDTAEAMVKKADADMIKLQTKLKDRYGDAEAIVGMATSCVSALGSVATGAGAIGMAGASLKRSGSVNVYNTPLQSSTPLDPRAFKHAVRGY